MELFGYTVRARGIPVADIDARDEEEAQQESEDEGE